MTQRVAQFQTVLHLHALLHSVRIINVETLLLLTVVQMTFIANPAMMYVVMVPAILAALILTMEMSWTVVVKELKCQTVSTPRANAQILRVLNTVMYVVPRLRNAWSVATTLIVLPPQTG